MSKPKKVRVPILMANCSRCPDATAIECEAQCWDGPLCPHNHVHLTTVIRR